MIAFHTQRLQETIKDMTLKGFTSSYPVYHRKQLNNLRTINTVIQNLAEASKLKGRTATVCTPFHLQVMRAERRLMLH